MEEGESNASNTVNAGTESQMAGGASDTSGQAPQDGGSQPDATGGDAGTGNPPTVTVVTPSDNAEPSPPEQPGDPGDSAPTASKSRERTSFKRHWVGKQISGS